MKLILAYLVAYSEVALLILLLVWIVTKIAGLRNPKRWPRLSRFATRISAFYRRGAPAALGIVATTVLLFLAALALNSVGFSRRPRNDVAMRIAVHPDSVPRLNEIWRYSAPAHRSHLVHFGRQPGRGLFHGTSSRLSLRPRRFQGSARYRLSVTGTWTLQTAVSLTTQASLLFTSTFLDDRSFNKKKARSNV